MGLTPKKDHSANVARIVLVKYTIGSVVEINLPEISQAFGKIILIGNEQDLGHQSIVNT